MRSWETYILHYGIIINMNSLYYSSIEVLIDFITSYDFISNSIFNSASSFLWLHEFSLWKLPSSCLLNLLSVSGCLMIYITWPIHFQMVCLFYMVMSLFSIRHIRSSHPEVWIHSKKCTWHDNNIQTIIYISFKNLLTQKVTWHIHTTSI